MSGRERRTARRYVIDGLFVDLGGVLHETVDISVCAVALVRRSGIHYSAANRTSWFLSTNVTALTRSVSEMEIVIERKEIVVFDYFIRESEFDPKAWEELLRRHDVRADSVPLEQIFG